MAARIDFLLGAYLKPALVEAKRQGVNVDAHIRRSGLHIIDVWNADAIPLTGANRLVREFAAEGDGLVPHELARCYSPDAVAGWGDAINGAADVQAAINLAGQPHGRLITNNPVVLQTNGRTAILIDRYLPRLEDDAEWLAIFSLFLIINAFRKACGEGWLPETLEVPFEDISVLEDTFDLGKVTIRTGQTETRLHFDISTLGRRMPGPVVSSDDCAHVARTMEQQIYSILDTLRPEVIPSFDRISEFLDTSMRTLQRRLADEGTTYKDVFTRWRMAKAVKLLDDPRLQVQEIAASLHYRHPSHFIRAFKKISGVTPVEFREAS